MDAGSIDKHTAIIAQSGSGKSFFLGRLIEEIILNTQARCVILDPNADFRKIDKAQPETLWTDAKYDPITGKGKMPTEATRSTFLRKWPDKRIGIITCKPRIEDSDCCRPFKIHWPSIDVDFMADELAPTQQSGLRLCHNFVCRVSSFCGANRTKKELMELPLLQYARDLLHQSRTAEDPAKFRASFEKDLLRKKVDKALVFQKFLTGIAQTIIPSISPIVYAAKAMDKARDIVQIIQSRTDDEVGHIVNAYKHISEDVALFYFARAFEYDSAGLLDKMFFPEDTNHACNDRIRILDIPSFENRSHSLLAINGVLKEEWSRAKGEWEKAQDDSPDNDKRAPTFIVLDEAHNLIPISPRDKASSVVKEQFLRIVAEGRKYGLFLIIVTQRPDKIDPMVLSECENYAIMKLSNEKTVDIVGKTLNLDDVPKKRLEKCLDFRVSRVLLAGRWAPQGGEFGFTAARRTEEGGRDLQAKHWAKPPPPVRKKTSKAKKKKGKVKKKKSKAKKKKTR